MKGNGLVEEARKQVLGQSSDRTQWNKVTVGNNSFTVERSTIVRAKINLDDIHFTPAFENKPYKDQCELCKAYFVKASVKYSVPNHRILSLQKKWKHNKEGKRYGTAAFLYATSHVCTFCAQLFQDVTPEVEVKARDTPLTGKRIEFLAPTNEKEGLIIETKIVRRNIAPGKRVYQSSVVDNLEAENALIIVDKGIALRSKTRREVDPWWEIDLGAPQNIHSLSFQISSSVMQRLSFSIFLLKKPIGFEDPFIDHMSKNSITFKDYSIEARLESHTEVIHWEFPINTICTAIRIQLRDVGTLKLKQFQLLQGDNLIEVSKSDVDTTKNSYATISPQKMKTEMFAMMSPFKKKLMAQSKLIYDIEPVKKTSKESNEIVNLSNTIEKRYKYIDNWKNKVKPCVDYFESDEILWMYRSIFLPIIEAGIADGSGNKYNKSYKLNENELLNESLIEYYPQISIVAIFDRLKLIIRWIQARTHGKEIGSLYTSEKFISIADEIEEHFYKFNKDVKDIEKQWDVITRQKRIAHSHNILTKEAFVPPEFGCCWSQFIILMRYFCEDQTHRIGPNAFDLGIDIGPDPYANLDKIDDLNMSYVLDDDDNTISTTVSKFVRPSLETITDPSLLEKVRSSNRFPIPQFGFAKYKLNNLIKRVELDPIFPKELRPDFVKFMGDKLDHRKACRSRKLNNSVSLDQMDFADTNSSIGNAANGLGDTHDPNDTFSDFNSIGTSPSKSRPVSPIVFNPNLGGSVDLDSMSVSTTLSRRNTAEGKTRPNTGARAQTAKEEMQSNELETKSVNSTAGLNKTKIAAMLAEQEFLKTLPRPMNNGNPFAFPDKNDEEETLVFYKYCAMCGLKFPNEAMEIKVLWKHVITLRRKWDPSLVSKELEALDQTISMYNLVHVCLFCGQFFDPDFEGGIAYPQKDQIKTKESGALAAIESSKSFFTKDLIPFYDFAYDSKPICGDASWRAKSAKPRSTAKSTITQAKVGKWIDEEKGF